MQSKGFTACAGSMLGVCDIDVSLPSECRVHSLQPPLRCLHDVVVQRWGSQACRWRLKAESRTLWWGGASLRWRRGAVAPVQQTRRRERSRSSDSAAGSDNHSQVLSAVLCPGPCCRPRRSPIHCQHESRQDLTRTRRLLPRHATRTKAACAPNTTGTVIRCG